MAAVVIVILVALFLYGAATNDGLRLGHLRQVPLQRADLSVGLVNTLQLTVYSMVLAIVLGVILAVMRLSPNPVFRSVSWVYLWIFRGTPVYVQLVFWGLIPTIYKNIQLGVPFGPSFFHLNLQDAVDPVSCWRSSAWRSTRPPTWPRSSAPESVPCRRASRRRRRRWACRGG